MSDDNPDPETIERITDALANGQKIEAIKIYTEATGKRLKEAHEFISELMPQLAEKDPERFGHLAKGKAGCGAAVLLLAAGLSCVVVLLLKV